MKKLQKSPVHPQQLRAEEIRYKRGQEGSAMSVTKGDPYMAAAAIRTFYANVDPRRKQEMLDGEMIREDHNAMANLSPVAIHCEFPEDDHLFSPFLGNQYGQSGL